MTIFDQIQLEERLEIEDIEKKAEDEDAVDGVLPEDNEDVEETVDAD